MAFKNSLIEYITLSSAPTLTNYASLSLLQSSDFFSLTLNASAFVRILGNISHVFFEIIPIIVTMVVLFM